jgi:hypothetical protein
MEHPTMVQSTISRNLTDIEHDLEEALRSKRSARGPGHDNAAPPRVSAPALAIPEYVEHQDGATEIGKLSAEAVVREFEAAAKGIEAMGAELIERVKQCEAMTRNAFAVTEELKETAARYREEAKRVFVEIESCSQVTSEVRKTCTELKERITVQPLDKKT